MGARRIFEWECFVLCNCFLKTELYSKLVGLDEKPMGDHMRSQLLLLALSGGLLGVK